MSHTTPNAVPCSQVLAGLYSFMDGEPTAVDGHLMHQHLAECSPCHEEHLLAEVLKSLVARSCCAQPAPERVRARVVAQITRIEVQISRVRRDPI